MVMEWILATEEYLRLCRVGAVGQSVTAFTSMAASARASKVVVVFFRNMNTCSTTELNADCCLWVDSECMINNLFFMYEEIQRNT